MRCLDDDMVLGLVEGRLAPPVLATVDEHLDICASCRDIVTQVARSLAPASRPLERGETVGRYVIGDLVGSGAMGRVYSAWEPELDRRVALKLLTTTDTSARDRAIREAKAMAKLDHPNVVGVHEVGTTDDAAYVAMELVEGDTLRAYTSKSWRETIALLADIARGLAAVHAAGVVHRDVKPDNIVVGRDHRARIADFGLARAGSSTARSSSSTFAAGSVESPETTRGGTDPTASHSAGGTATNDGAPFGLPGDIRAHVGALGTVAGTALAGTPAYMAPEVANGESATSASDQFSFGVTAYEVLAGSRPFAATTFEQLREEYRSSTIAPLREVPAWLDAAIRRCLSIDPAARFASLLDFADIVTKGLQPRQGARMAIGGVAVAALVASSVTYVALRQPAAGPSCEAGASEIEATWNATKRAELAHVGEPALRALDAWMKAWAAEKNATCAAAKYEAPAMTIARGRCLERRRDEAAALIAALSKGTNASSGDASNARSGNASNARSGNASNASSGNATDARSGNARSGNASNASSGNAMDASSGDASNARSGNASDASSGNASRGNPSYATDASSGNASSGNASDASSGNASRGNPSFASNAASSVGSNAGPSSGTYATYSLIDTLAALPAPDECATAASDPADPIPLDKSRAAIVLDVQRQLASLRATLALGDARPILKASATLVEIARSSQHAPTLAEAQLLHADVLRATSQLDAAVIAVRAAAADAERGHADQLAARIWLARVAIAGDRRDLASADDLLAIASGAIDRAGAPPRLAAMLLKHHGLVSYNRGDLNNARSFLTEAHAKLVELAKRGDDLGVTVDRIAVESALGSVERAAGNLDSAERWHQRALDADRALRGEVHPDIARDLHNLAGVARLRGDLVLAFERYAQALAIEIATRGEHSVEVGLTRNSLGLVALARAQAAMNPETPGARPSLEATRAETRVQIDEARLQFTRARDIFAAASHGDRAFAEHNLGLVDAASGDHGAAIAHFDAAARLYDATIGTSADAAKRLVDDRAASQRALGRARPPAAKVTTSSTAGVEPTPITTTIQPPPPVPAPPPAPDDKPPKRDVGVYGSTQSW